LSPERDADQCQAHRREETQQVERHWERISAGEQRQDGDQGEEDANTDQDRADAHHLVGG
jgi:hypothetical protein